MAYSHKFSRRNFSSGQYDREFSSQENAIQASGMLHCRNVCSSAQGECKTRPGTQYMADLGQETVLIPFRYDNRDIVLAFAEGKIDIFDFDAIGNLVPFQFRAKEKVIWENTSNNTPESTKVSITGEISGDTSIAYKWWTKSSYELLNDYTNNRLYVPTQTYPTTNFNMQFTAKKALAKLSIALIWADGNFSAGHLQGIKDWVKDAVLQYSDDGVNWDTVRLVAPADFGNRRMGTPNGTMPIPVLEFLTNTTGEHEYWRVVIVWDRTRAPNNAPFIALFTDGVEASVPVVYQQLETPYVVDQLRALKYSQQYNELIVCDGINLPHVFSITGGVPSFVSKNFNFIQTDDVPSCVRFFQNRLYFGGFEANPTRVRGSRFGDFSDFTVITDNAGPADPISSDCNQFASRITDLWGGFTILYAQSADGIAFLENGTSTPSFTLRCSERAAGITPTMKDNIMFYVGYDCRKIHAFSFDNDIQQFVAPDISKYWQEVLKEQITEIHYVDSRNDNLLCLMKDGTAVSILYDGRNAGYFPIGIGGFIYDMSVVKVNDDYKILMVVHRGDINWGIEQWRQPDYMERTNAFEQTPWERNIATQENLKETPFFDAWRVVVNEQNTLWSYTKEDNIIKPLAVSDNPVDLSPYVGKYVRFYYGSGIRDYNDLKILEVFDSQQTITTERTEVVETRYYAWANITGVNATGRSSSTYSGYYARTPSGDTNSETTTGNRIYAWTKGSITLYTGNEYPVIGNTLTNNAVRPTPLANIDSVVGSFLWTKSNNPKTGDPVYNENLELIGVVAVGGTSITYDGKTYAYYSSKDKTTSETITITEEYVVEGGSYLVEAPDGLESQVFNKIQLPIESINVPYETVQIQDNGVYKGTFKAVNGVVEFDEPMYDIQYGIPYRKIGVVEDNRAYLRQKQWGAVAVNVIDTLALKVGSRLDKMTEVIKITGTQFFDSNILMKNGTLIVNIADTPEYEKKLIFMTDEGLPFTILAIENDGNISDRGAN